MKLICLGIASFALFVPAIARAADEPVPVPAIPWLHEGLVFTSTWMQARVQGNDTAYHENINGEWQDAYGNVFKESDVHGTSAGGVSQIVITCIEGDKIVATSQGYADVRALGLSDPMPLQNAIGSVTRIGQNSENWIDPVRLAAAKSDPAAGTLVDGTQWRRPEGMRDAIRIVRVGSDGYSDHVYDKKTGICVHYAMSTKSAPTPQPLAAGQENQGDTTLTQGDFLAARDIKVPWSHEDVPVWVDQFKVLHYRGQITFRNSALPQIPNEILLDAMALDHGNGWMRVNTSVDVKYQNMPALPPANGQVVSGRAQFGGFWAGPKALGKLRQGDLLDEDPITKMRTTVSRVDDQSVTISQSNNSGEIVSEYDPQTGVLIGSSYYNAVSKQDWGVHLRGRQ